MSDIKDHQEASQKKPVTYKDAGVDIDAGAEAVRRISALAKTTFNSRVITDIGGFSGLYSLALSDIKDPVLVSGTDGVGTKLKVAFLTGRHDTIGIDLVAMGVNDILAQGAKPLFFLDYLATSKVEPQVVESIVQGIAEGCRQSGCALIGGETAELPDFYAPEEYDLAGFVVGVVDRGKIIDGSEIGVGDHLIGLGSTGLHSNGYSLVRRIIFDHLGKSVDDPFGNTTFGTELLEPTKIYVNTVHMLIRDFKILGIAHITGGGILENVPRVLPQGCRAVINKDAWTPQPIFRFLQEAGNIAENEMFRTFNMGLGLVIVVRAQESREILDRLNAMNEKAYLIGKIEERPKGEKAIVLV